MLTESLEKIQYFGGSGFVPICSADAVVECFSMGMSGPPLHDASRAILFGLDLC